MGGRGEPSMVSGPLRPGTSGGEGKGYERADSAGRVLASPCGGGEGGGCLVEHGIGLFLHGGCGAACVCKVASHPHGLFGG
jgi:hypothetical protein